MFYKFYETKLKKIESTWPHFWGINEQTAKKVPDKETGMNEQPDNQLIHFILERILSSLSFKFEILSSNALCMTSIFSSTALISSLIPVVLVPSTSAIVVTTLEEV